MQLTVSADLFCYSMIRMLYGSLLEHCLYRLTVAGCTSYAALFLFLGGAMLMLTTGTFDTNVYGKQT